MNAPTVIPLTMPPPPYVFAAGFQINDLEPFGLRIFWYSPDYAEVWTASMKIGSAELDRERKVWRSGRKIYPTLTLWFDSFVKMYDRSAWQYRRPAKAHGLSDASPPLTGFCNPMLEDESLIDVAAVSLGMGAKMLPSNRYSSNP